MSKKMAFLFPGQGAQFPGMARDFYENFKVARHLFEEADDLLKRNLSKLIFEGPESELTETANSQPAIFVTSVAILKSLQSAYPHLTPFCCAGLSLGEYVALTAAGYLPFAQALHLVQLRGKAMNEACEQTKGTMAVVLGLEKETVESTVAALNQPNDLWVANYNCPGQIVISGTLKGVQLGSEALMKVGAKRVLPLQVHGAFHSGLMQWAKDALTDPILTLPLQKSLSQIVMNVPGDFVDHPDKIRQNLILQVTSSVKWEQSIRSIIRENVDFFLTFGPGNTLAPMNKRIGVTSPTFNLEKVADLQQFEGL